MECGVLDLGIEAETVVPGDLDEFALDLHHLGIDRRQPDARDQAHQPHQDEILAVRIEERRVETLDRDLIAIADRRSADLRPDPAALRAQESGVTAGPGAERPPGRGFLLRRNEIAEPEEQEIGRASWRESECPYLEHAVVAVSLTTTQSTHLNDTHLVIET